MRPSTTASTLGCSVASARGVKAAASKLAHARVQRRVVEHQAGGVMAVERRADAEFRTELGLLVGTHAGIAIAESDIDVAREKDAAVGQALQRREAPERMIVREGIVEEAAFQRRQIESPSKCPGLVRRQLDEAPGQN